MATMNENFNLYMKAEKFSPASVEVYVRNINGCLKYIGKPDNEITELDLMAWKDSLSGKASATVAQKITCVKTYFRFLKRHHFVEINPAEYLDSIHVQNKEKHHMTAEQIRAMMDAAGNIKMKAMISLMASSGMRVSELTGVTLEAYNNMRANHENKMYIIGKGNKKAPVVFNEQSCKLIDEYIKVRETGAEYLFLSRQGGHIARSNLGNSLKLVAKNAGITWWESMSPHQLRAATATVLSDKGVPVAQIRDVLRHSSISTTNRYIRGSEQDIKANVMNMSF